MRVANCLIIKEENKYLREYVEYYKYIGYDCILLYDNNNVDGEHPSEVIQDYIDSGFVLYHDLRGQIRVQKNTYNNCLKSYKKDFDWISFFDTDEFLTVIDIKKFLSSSVFQNFDEILINWTSVDDGDLLDSDLPLLKRNSKKVFPISPMTNVPAEWTVKTIVRTSSSAKFVTSIHHASGNIKSCNYHGKPVFSCLYVPSSNAVISLVHFRTKTVCEYMKRIQVGDVNLKHDLKLMYTKIKSFFLNNNITEEKLKIIQKHFPDWKLNELKDRNIDAVVLAKNIKDSDIRQYMPFINKIWRFDAFSDSIKHDVADRLIVITQDIKFNHLCIEQDFFIEGQVAKTEDNVIVPLFKTFCKESLEDSIKLHYDLGKRDHLSFLIGNSLTKISLI